MSEIQIDIPEEVPVFLPDRKIVGSAKLTITADGVAAELRLDPGVLINVPTLNNFSIDTRRKTDGE